MDKTEYEKIISSGQQALQSARNQSEHPVMEKYGMLLRSIAAREGFDLSGAFIRTEQLLTKLLVGKLKDFISTGNFLEIGCGFDPLVVPDKRIANRYYMDLHIEALKESRKESQALETTINSSFLKADLNKTLPYKSNSIGTTALVNTSGAIKNYDEFSREIWRVLNPEGKLVICGDAEPNMLPGSSGSFYLNNELWAHEILEKLKNNYSVEIYLAGPVLPFKKIGEFRENSGKGSGISEELLKTGEFSFQEATHRMTKFASGKRVGNSEEHKELTETRTRSGKKHFAAYMKIIVAEKRLAGKGWGLLTETEKKYAMEKLRLLDADKDCLAKIDALSQKSKGKNTDEMEKRLVELRSQDKTGDTFALKKEFPHVFAQGKRKKIRNPRQACIVFLEKELEKSRNPLRNERLEKFTHKPEVRRALLKKQFLETENEQAADKLMKDLDI